MFSRIIGVAVLVIAVVSGTGAQWRKISTPEIETNPRMQAITYKAGRLWVATQDTLRMTSNNGATWHVRNPEDSVGAIQAMDFFDDLNGVFSTKKAIYRTKDGGLNWDTIHVSTDVTYTNCFAVKFFGSSPDNIAFGLDDSVKFYITRDGGLTWDSTDFRQEGTGKPWDTMYYAYEELKDIQTTPKGTVRVLLLRKTKGGSQIATTFDYGKTWTFSDDFDYDCFSFAIDECKEDKWYVINEEVFVPWDRTAVLYRSLDAGDSWQSLIGTANLNYYTGSLSVSQGGVIYVQTANEGVLRSNDYGNYWTKIGGPSGIPDTRLIVAVSDEVVYGADNKGRVWMTDNGGGSAAGNPDRTKLELSKKFLFTNAFGNICGDTLTDTLVLSYPECPTVIFNGAYIAGNITDYTILWQRNDTIVVQFIPQAINKRYAELVLNLNLATKQVVPLVGAGYVPKFILTSTTPSLFDGDSVVLCDTIFRGLWIRTEGCIVPDISTQTLTGSAGFDYWIVDQLPKVLTGDDSITVAFAPKMRGPRPAGFTMRFADNTVKSIPLRGFGIDPGPKLIQSRAELFDRDSVALCTSMLDTVVVRSNVCVSKAIAWQAIMGSDAGDYQIVRLAPTVLTGSDTIILRFTPTASGLRTAEYHLMTNDSVGLILPLSGKCFDGKYAFTSPAEIFKGDTISLCDTIICQFAVYSAGCVVPDVATQTITGGPEYSLVLGVPQRLTGSDMVTIKFAPKATGLRPGLYELELADGNKTSVSLNGVGSDAPYTLNVTPQLLFDEDSLFACESAVRTITIKKSGCAQVRVASESCSTADYTLLDVLTDSLTSQSTIRIEFRPTTSGLRPADYILTLEDGSTITIPLLGFGKQPATLRIQTAPAFTTDTIGGDINIPITVTGLNQPRTVEFVLAFDRNLEYQGTTSIGGTVLDLPGTRTANSSRIQIPASDIRPNAVSAYANFQLFVDTEEVSHVSVSGLELPSQVLPCEFIIQDIPALTSIEGPVGCTIISLSDFLRYNKRSRYHIRPNPTSGRVSISTNMVTEAEQITVIDAMGTERLRTSAAFSATLPTPLDLSQLPSGMYFVRISGDVIPILLEK